MEHQTQIALGNELIDQGSLHEGREAVLDELFVAEGLLELAARDLERIPPVDVQVTVLDARLPLTEVGKEAELVILEERGFQTEASAAENEPAGIGQVGGIGIPAIVGLELTGHTQAESFVGGADVETIIPAGQDAHLRTSVRGVL